MYVCTMYKIITLFIWFNLIFTFSADLVSTRTDWTENAASANAVIERPVEKLMDEYGRLAEENGRLVEENKRLAYTCVEEIRILVEENGKLAKENTKMK